MIPTVKFMHGSSVGKSTSIAALMSDARMSVAGERLRPARPKLPRVVNQARIDAAQAKRERKNAKRVLSSLRCFDGNPCRRFA